MSASAVADESALASARAQLQALGEELAETNRGVMVLYAELDDKAQQLRQATELKSNFLSYMSHEFRTPLGSILSITRLLLDRYDGPLSAEQEKQIKFIDGSARELTEMVSDLLDLAKIEAGRITVSPAWFELVDLFSALRGLFRPILANQSVNLVFEEPQGDMKLYTDDRKLSQILRNFISNAIKFTPEGEVRVVAREGGDGTVTFSVADTGVGIDAAHQEMLFRDFVQLEGPQQRRVKGTGLGLSICKRFAELLGGKVGMESTPGRGSTFHVTVPVRLEGGPRG